MTEKGYDQNLKQLNKYSNKISKPLKKYPFDQHPNYQHKQQKTHVYNINKSDFRELVQQLTGPSSQVYHPLPPPPQPLIHNPKPQSSRLYSIRPPPLTTKTPVLSSATTITTIKDEQNPQPQQVSSALSPLPPFPSVNFTAESPISAYMRYLRSTTPTNTTAATSDFESSKGQSDFLFSSPLFTPTTTAQLEFEFPQAPPTTLAPSWKNV